MTGKKSLPIGIETFAKIRQDNHHYVDKTQYILELINFSNYIFLSRPRRFGKSLTLDTIAELFEGNQALFEGLYAHTNWDWATKHPIIRVSFVDGVKEGLDRLEKTLTNQLNETANRYNVALTNEPYIAIRFRNLITTLHEKYQQKVVILIDEYDKPILDNLVSDNAEQAKQMREALRDFYSVIKGQDARLRFVMLTGVSQFSKVNLFSGLNNLTDVTLLKQFSAICGYTQSELEGTFADELTNVDLEKVKEWYNGYNWTGEKVYNPFDILLFLADSDRVFQPFWFATGTPDFLMKVLQQEGVEKFDITQMTADKLQLSKLDIEDIHPIALMFQTGYLTIENIFTVLDSPYYQLNYPNREVRQSLSKLLLAKYLHKKEEQAQAPAMLVTLLANNDFNGLEQLLKSFIASISYDWHRNNTIARYEGYWASVLFTYFASIGFDIDLEDMTNHGRIDMTVKFQDRIYLFEFKVLANAQAKSGLAIAQILDNNYSEKYLATGKTIYQIGIEINAEDRQIQRFDMVEKR